MGIMPTYFAESDSLTEKLSSSTTSAFNSSESEESDSISGRPAEKKSPVSSRV